MALDPKKEACTMAKSTSAQTAGETKRGLSKRTIWSGLLTGVGLVALIDETVFLAGGEACIEMPAAVSASGGGRHAMTPRGFLGNLHVSPGTRYI